MEDGLCPASVFVWGELEHRAAAFSIAYFIIAAGDSCAVEISGSVEYQSALGTCAVGATFESVNHGLFPTAVLTGTHFENSSAERRAESARAAAASRGCSVKIA